MPLTVSRETEIENLMREQAEVRRFRAECGERLVEIKAQLKKLRTGRRLSPRSARTSSD
jgi:hypothetical protein